MEIILRRHPIRKGCTDEWSATVPGLRPGIGSTRSHALGSLLSANLDAFGVTSRVDIDPGSDPVTCVWRKAL